MIRAALSKLRGLIDPNSRDPFAGRDLHRHQESWIETKHLGVVIPPYHPTYPFEGFLGPNHARFASCAATDGVLVDLGIPGWLRREDALKIYELAYYSPGDILEIGTYQGLSTSIIAGAIADSGKKALLTVDLSPELSSKAQTHLLERGLSSNVSFFVNDATAFCQKLISEGRSHEYGPVAEVCRLMDKLITPRGLCLFHDFNDARNNDPDNPHYGVSGAVKDALPSDRFEFHGIFGCAALYRAKGIPA
jgi:hypothetical protein